jgi:aryl-alcohol dehydrogenase-like predicted oxidoreductase
VRSRPFTTSVIIGATSMAQLRTNLGACDMVLGADIVAAIDAIHTDIPNPAP